MQRARTKCARSTLTTAFPIQIDWPCWTSSTPITIWWHMPRPCVSLAWNICAITADAYCAGWTISQNVRSTFKIPLYMHYYYVNKPIFTHSFDSGTQIQITIDDTFVHKLSAKRARITHNQRLWLRCVAMMPSIHVWLDSLIFYCFALIRVGIVSVWQLSDFFIHHGALLSMCPTQHRWIELM